MRNGIRSKKITDCFLDGGEFMGAQLKKNAGFGKGKEKNFDGVIADLQMQTYLTIKDFRRKVNKRGGEYGMPVCIYSRPEDIWGYEMISSLYREDPEECRRKINDQVRNSFPSATENSWSGCCGENICKNLFLCNRQETDFYLLMMPGTKKFKTKDLSKQLGVSRLSFASEIYMEKFLDITPGSVSVMGLMNDTDHRVQLVIDEDVLAGEYVGCHPCINTSSLRIKTQELVEKILPAMEHRPIVVHLEITD